MTCLWLQFMPVLPASENNLRITPMPYQYQRQNRLFFLGKTTSQRGISCQPSPNHCPLPWKTNSKRSRYHIMPAYFLRLVFSRKSDIKAIAVRFHSYNNPESPELPTVFFPLLGTPRYSSPSSAELENAFEKRHTI